MDAIILVVPNRVAPLGFNGCVELLKSGEAQVTLQQRCSTATIYERQTPVTLVAVGNDLEGKGKPISILGLSLPGYPDNLAAFAVKIEIYPGYAFEAQNAKEVLDSIFRVENRGMRRF